MNSLVYPVSGGMEDWAYAATWDDLKKTVTPCKAKGYPSDRTVYENKGMLRILNILVETSDNKRPNEKVCLCSATSCA